MSLSAFLTSHRKAPKQAHTHTWFASGPKYDLPCTLHIPDNDLPTLRRLLVAEAAKGAKGKQSEKSGNVCSISEKICKGSAFQFVADLDFKPAEVEKWAGEKGYTDERIILARLTKKLRDVISLYRSVVAEATSQPAVAMVLATRLPYKIHLHFPGIIVDAKSAKGLATAFAARFAKEHPDLFSETVTDSSIYQTGLRMLYCHKGSMVKADKRDEEQVAHEALFGAGSYCDVYFITDLDTWKQNRVASVQDLTLTSIQAAEDAELTKLEIRKGGGAKGKEKAGDKRKGKAVAKRSNTQSRIEDNPALHTVLGFVCEELDLDLNQMLDEPTRRGECLIVATRIQDCPFAKRTHRGNHLYIVFAQESIELRCHDTECSESRKVTDIPDEIRLSLQILLADEIQLQNADDNRIEAMERSLDRVKNLHPRMDVTEALTDVKHGHVGGAPVYSVNLVNNRWCPTCKKEHDSPENCVVISQQLQQIMCKRIGLTEMIDIPLPGDLKNVIFAVNNLNVNVNMTNDPNEVKEFGTFDEFPRPYGDDELNRLCSF